MILTARLRTRCAAACAALALSLAPLPLGAQTIVGRVLDEANNDPVEGVVVKLVDRDGDEMARVMTDTGGAFTLAPPEAGEYILVAERFGYVDTRSPLLALVVEGDASLELMISPAPIGLEGLEVSVEEEASEELRIMGISPASLGNGWIDRRRIEAIPVKVDMGSILENTAQSGLAIIRPGNLVPGSDDMGLCVTLARTRNMGRGRCALIVLNGIRIGGPQALDVDPNTIESMAVLGPIEASIQFGTDGGGGVLLVWTQRGR